MLSSAISGTPMLRRISAMPSRSWAGSGCSTSSRSPYFDRADDRDRLLGGLPSHVAVDAKLHVRADRLADRFHRRDVARRVLAADLHLDGAMTPLQPARARARPSGRAGRRGSNSSAECARGPCRRGDCRPACRAPCRRCPTAPSRCRPCLPPTPSRTSIHLPDDAGDAERILADHRRNERLSRTIMMQQRAAPLEHAVDLAKARDAGIGLDEDDGVVGKRRRTERGFVDAAKGTLSRTEDRHAADVGDFHRGALN